MSKKEKIITEVIKIRKDSIKEMESKMTSVVIAALSGAVTGTVVALMTPTKQTSKSTNSAISRAAGHMLDTTGKVMISVGENLKHR